MFAFRFTKVCSQRAVLHACIVLQWHLRGLAQGLMLTRGEAWEGNPSKSLLACSVSLSHLQGADDIWVFCWLASSRWAVDVLKGVKREPSLSGSHGACCWGQGLDSFSATRLVFTCQCWSGHPTVSVHQMDGVLRYPRAFKVPFCAENLGPAEEAGSLLFPQSTLQRQGSEALVFLSRSSPWHHLSTKQPCLCAHAGRQMPTVARLHERFAIRGQKQLLAQH